MIAGHVTNQLEARIPLFVEDAQGQPFSLQAVVDTGFSEFLALPPAIIAPLGLPWVADQSLVHADGTTTLYKMYSAVVVWDGQPRPIQAYAVDTNALVGMKMLAGHELGIRVVNGGSVWIDLVP